MANVKFAQSALNVKVLNCSKLPSYISKNKYWSLNIIINQEDYEFLFKSLHVQEVYHALRQLYSNPDLHVCGNLGTR